MLAEEKLMISRAPRGKCTDNNLPERQVSVECQNVANNSG